jgi:RNA polymerase sigma factor (sigma-70 family)
LAPHEEDLIQEARLALLTAAGRFREEVGATFTTYAWWWMSQAVYRAALRVAGPVRVPGPNQPWTCPAPLHDGDSSGTSALTAEDSAVFRELVAAFREAALQGSEGHKPSRDADLFLRALLFEESFAELGREYQLSRERVRQIHQQMFERFEQWRSEFLAAA